MVWYNPVTWFNNRPKLIAYFIDETGHVFRREVKYENNKFDLKYAGEHMTYIVDHERMLYDAKKNQGTSFYYVNNPEPIRFQHMRNKDLDSVGFRKILESKAIIDLFSEEGMNRILILIILTSIVLFLVVVSLAKQFNLIGAGNGTG
jgi:hypothetical protein